MVLKKPKQTNSNGRYPPREEKSVSFTPHPSTGQHFITDLEEDIDGKLAADHTEVRMLVADSYQNWNNHQVGRLSQNQQEDILKTVRKTL